jgi:hypothetical protein
MVPEPGNPQALNRYARTIRQCPGDPLRQALDAAGIRIVEHKED